MGEITPALSGARKWAEVQRNPFVPQGAHQRGQNQKWQHHPSLLRGPKAEVLHNTCHGGGGASSMPLIGICCIGGPEAGGCDLQREVIVEALYLWFVVV